MKRGLFIVFEGGEGTGKTTAIEAVYDWIVENNFKCIKTREPVGIKISEQIRCKYWKTFSSKSSSYMG